MASNSVSSSRLSPVDFSSNPKDTKSQLEHQKETSEDIEVDEPQSNGVLPGAQLSNGESFQKKNGASFSVTPVIIDFRRLLECKSNVPVVAGIPNRELLHAVVALYDVSLSEMTPDVLYSTVCDEKARNIILVRDLKDTEENPFKSAKEEEAATNSEPQQQKEQVADATVSEEVLKELEKDIDACEDVFSPVDDPPPAFVDVYSDTDKSEEESEDENEVDFSKGMNSFIDKVKARRTVKKYPDYKPKNSSSIYGAESRIVAAATYSKTYVKSGLEKVVHLTLIATRKRFRKCGIGRYLLNQIKDPTVVGQYDAVVVHADNSAVEFFERYGFSDDIILNSRWSELAEQFTNCTLMCYLPPFTTSTLLVDSVPELDILAMEKEMRKWREKSVDAYRAEVSCMNRMRNEMIHLRALVASQQNLITSLAAENQSLRRSKYAVEKEFLEYKILSAKTFINSDHSDEDEDADLNDLIKRLESEANLKKLMGPKSYSKLDSDGRRKYMFSGGDSQDEPYDHGRDTEEFFKVSRDFYDAMRLDHSITTAYEVKLVTKAILTTTQEESFKLCINNLKEPSMVTRLYFCGSLERPNRIPDILKKGFIEEDFSHGDYGVGLYFSQLPSKAAQFSALGKMLLAEVGIGNTETVVEKNRLRKKASKGYDAIITPGRLQPRGAAQSDAQSCQEYVVFDVNQVKPMYLIEYSPIGV